uniref:Uncharacterized protein n=1 Tax=Arundo donax TaxID=35708 RepID=A0A0A9FPZ2_ARUDO
MKTINCVGLFSCNLCSAGMRGVPGNFEGSVHFTKFTSNSCVFS